MSPLSQVFRLLQRRGLDDFAPKHIPRAIESYLDSKRRCAEFPFFPLFAEKMAAKNLMKINGRTEHVYFHLLRSVWLAELTFQSVGALLL